MRRFDHGSHARTDVLITRLRGSLYGDYVSFDHGSATVSIMDNGAILKFALGHRILYRITLWALLKSLYGIHVTISIDRSSCEASEIRQRHRWAWPASAGKTLASWRPIDSDASILWIVFIVSSICASINISLVIITIITTILYHDPWSSPDARLEPTLIGPKWIRMSPQEVRHGFKQQGAGNHRPPSECFNLGTFQVKWQLVLESYASPVSSYKPIEPREGEPSRPTKR